MALDSDVVGVVLVNDAGITPHSPVRLWLRGIPRRQTVRVLMPPLRPDPTPPSGCLNADAFADWDEIVDVERPEMFGGSLLDESFGVWMGRIEHQISDI